MDKEYKIKIGKIIFQAAKIAVGSCGAISIAMALNLYPERSRYRCGLHLLSATICDREK